MRERRSLPLVRGANPKRSATLVNARRDRYDVLIARPSKWDNPFVIGQDGTRDQVIEKYKVWVKTQPSLLGAIPSLQGKRLGCYCGADQRCHGEVLLDLLEDWQRALVDTIAEGLEGKVERGVAYDPRKHGADCDSCPLNKRKPVPPEAAVDALRFVVVGEAPGRYEEKTGQPFCLVPETLVLMADLSWKQLGEIATGDRVMAVDDDAPIGPGASKRGARQWGIAEVTATHRSVRECYAVETEFNQLIGTGDHRVLTAHKKKYEEDPTAIRYGKRWQRIDDLVCGAQRQSRLVHIGHRSWEPLQTYEAGWLAGFLDGEGHVLGSKSKRVKRAGVVGFAQNAGPVFEYATKIATDLGFAFRATEKRPAYKPSGNACWSVNFRGDLPQMMRILGTIRPQRLLADFARVLSREDAARPSIRNLPTAHVTARYKVGRREVVDITTTRGTFIANGFVVHNCGPSGKLLNAVLSRNRLDRRQAHVTNAILCRSESDVDTAAAQVACAGRFFNELEKLDASAPIFALGAWAAKAVLGVRGIIKSRGFVWQVPKMTDVELRRAIKAAEDSHSAYTKLKPHRQRIAGRTVLPMLHPAFILRTETWAALLDVDMARASRFLEAGVRRFKLEDRARYRVVSNAADLRRFAARLGSVVTVDIETDGPDPLKARILCVGIGDTKTTIIANPWRASMARVLSEIFRARTVVGHNIILFDAIVLRRDGVRIERDQIEDTMVAHHAFASHLPKSLLHVGSVFVDASPWKQQARGEGKNEKGLPQHLEKHDLELYNAGDVRVTALCWDRMPGAIEPEARVYENDKRMAELCARMRIHGFAFDIDRARELGKTLQGRKNALLGEMRKLTKNGSFSPSKPNDIRKALFGRFHSTLIRPTATGLPSTARAVLEALRSTETKAGQLSDLVLRWREAEKTKGTYLSVPVGDDGRVHDNWRMATVCMPAGELVLTNRGYLEVQDVKKGDRVLSHTGKPRAVTAMIVNKPAPIYKVTLSNGLTLRTTPNHPYRSGEGWIRADELRRGDEVTTHSAPEEWRSVEGWPYEVSSWGRVRRTEVMQNSNHRGCILKQFPKGRWGHLKVCLARNGAQRRGPDRIDVPIHRLVLQVFGPGPPKGKNETRHLNGIAWDNTIGNLAWGSALENRQDSARHGTSSKRKGSQAKLTEAQVAFIRKSRISGCRLGPRFGVSRGLITAVRRGDRWQPRTPAVPVEFGTATVVSVAVEPLEVTYGLTVAVDHSHVTGGIVTHNTGRLAAKLVTLPKYTPDAKGYVDPTDRVRECYIAPPGWRLVAWDLSQCEMRASAHFSGDPNFIEACKGDVHAGNARVLFPDAVADGSLKDDKTAKTLGKKWRDIAKNAGFAVTYLAEWETVYAYLTSHGFPVSVRDVRAMLSRLHVAYAVYFEYVARNVAFVQKHGYLRTPLMGRIRWFGRYPKPTEVAAFPISGGIADFMNERLLRVDSRLDPRNAFLVAQVHDAAYIQCRENKVEQIENIVREEFNPPIRLVDGREFSIPIDLKSGGRWSEL